MPGLTVVPPSLARVGATYRFRGPCEEAAGCPVARLCQDQRPGIRYQVQQVRSVVHDSCKVYEGGAQVVEAQPLDPEGSLPASSLRGTLAEWKAPECTFRGCPHWSTCFDPALEESATYEVRSVGPALECAMGYQLHQVALRATMGRP